MSSPAVLKSPTQQYNLRSSARRTQFSPGRTSTPPEVLGDKDVNQGEVNDRLVASRKKEGGKAVKTVKSRRGQDVQTRGRENGDEEVNRGQRKDALDTRRSPKKSSALKTPPRSTVLKSPPRSSAQASPVKAPKSPRITRILRTRRILFKPESTSGGWDTTDDNKGNQAKLNELAIASGSEMECQDAVCIDPGVLAVLDDKRSLDDLIKPDLPALLPEGTFDDVRVASSLNASGIRQTVPYTDLTAEQWKLIEMVLETQAIHQDSLTAYLEAEKSWFLGNRISKEKYLWAVGRYEVLRDQTSIFTNMCELILRLFGYKANIVVIISGIDLGTIRPPNWKINAVAEGDFPKKITMTRLSVNNLMKGMATITKRFQNLTILSCPSEFETAKELRWTCFRPIKKVLEESNDVVYIYSRPRSN